jgi:hypothetical protein
VVEVCRSCGDTVDLKWEVVSGYLLCGVCRNELLRILNPELNPFVVRSRLREVCDDSYCGCCEKVTNNSESLGYKGFCAVCGANKTVVSKELLRKLCAEQLVVEKDLCDLLLWVGTEYLHGEVPTHIQSIWDKYRVVGGIK